MGTLRLYVTINRPLRDNGIENTAYRGNRNHSSHLVNDALGTYTRQFFLSRLFKCRRRGEIFLAIKSFSFVDNRIRPA